MIKLATYISMFSQMETSSVRIYTSFVVRCWTLEEPGRGQRSVVDLEHVQTGDHYRVASLIEAQQQMAATCQSLRPSGSLRQENSAEGKEGSS